MAFFDALSAVERERSGEVPDPIKDGNRDRDGFGHGKGYLYPHSYRDHWVAQQYLPDSLQGRLFYQPSDCGYEQTVKARVERLREAQLEAMRNGVPSPQVEGPRTAKERWALRSLTNAPALLERIRDRLFELADVAPQHLVLDLEAGTGLLTWEAIRRASQGGVYAWASSPRDGRAIEERARLLAEMARPIVMVGDRDRWSAHLQAQCPDIRFERILGRNALRKFGPVESLAIGLRDLLAKGGKAIFAETIPRYGQRLYQLLADEALDADVMTQWQQAEEAIYSAPEDPMVNWGEDDLRVAFERAGYAIELSVEQWTSEVAIRAEMLDRWFANPASGRPSYAQHLGKSMSAADVKRVESCLRRLQNQRVNWQNGIVFLQAKRAVE